jgi:uncharacterized protein (DUF1697 family)
MPTHIALLRGINVGRAKRVAMADLRQAVADLGYTNVRTLLNSGNIVFDSADGVPASIAVSLRDAIADKTGVTAEVIVISATDLDVIVSENPLGSVVTIPSRFLVAFPSAVAALKKTSALLKGDWSPDQFALGTRAAYLWCPSGMLDSKLAKEFDRLMGTTVTTRNWATVLKLHALSGQAKEG